MFPGRCAYRRAIQSCSTLLTDHVWISEELLTSTIRRFVNGQRRCESRVPGPLEARRRLAKRKNTALASIAGAGLLDDAAYLFGRNGREQMKWIDSRQGQVLDYQNPPSSPAVFPLLFYNEDISPTDPGKTPLDWPVADAETNKVGRDQFIREQLRNYRTASELKDAIRQLNIDLRREPRYSQMIFDHLVSRLVGEEIAIEELVLFLDDPHLNIPGAGNYLGAVQQFISTGKLMNRQRALLFDPMIRALGLGLIPPKEIISIIESLAGSGLRNIINGPLLTRLYRNMWDAIGRCDVYGHKDLDEDIFDTWLGVLLESAKVGDLLLAKDIMVASGHVVSISGSWVPKFITRWFEAQPGSRCLPSDANYVAGLLKPFDADSVSHSIICVTETLMTSEKAYLLKRWRSCLAKLHDASAIAASCVWTDASVHHTTGFSARQISWRHRIILRLWMLRELSNYENPAQKRDSNATHPTIFSLYRLYEEARSHGYKPEKNQDLWTSLINDIHDLNIPFDLSTLAADLGTGKSMAHTTRLSLAKFKSSPLSLSDIFADIDTYNSAVHHLFPLIDNMVRQTDITSSEIQDRLIHLARTGDPKCAWTLIRLIRSHTPLKVALARSWHTTNPLKKACAPRNADCLDPRAALELIHRLAAAFACSKRLSPRRAYNLVQWLCAFLYKHSAPVRPPLARALYHAGVVRFRREKSKVSIMQYRYIWSIVEEAEKPEIAGAVWHWKPPKS